MYNFRTDLALERRDIYQKVNQLNEIDGIEWVTVIEGRKEYAALRYKQSSLLIKPAELVWGRVKQQQVCNLSKEYECIKQSIEDLEN